MKKGYNNIYTKSQNTNSIRVLYKKVGQTPEVKIIDNVYKLKKAIVNKQLEIVAYQNVFIICHSKNKMKNMQQNIILDFSNISGDLLVIEIDRKKRELKSISQENIVWFTEDLTHRSPSQKSIVPKIDMKHFTEYISNDAKKFTNVKNSHHFENSLINILTNIQLTLSCLIANNKKGGN